MNRSFGFTRGRAACLCAGFGVLAAAFLSPLEALSERLFAAHMAQHMLLATIAPPLLVLGTPEHALLRVMAATSRWLTKLFVRARMLVAWRFFTRPTVACAVHAAAIWLWHAPALYVSTLRDERIHVLEHASFLGTGILLWCAILHPPRARARSREALAVGIIVLFATAVQTGALGALLALSGRVLYPAQSFASDARGLSPLDDQRLAGLLMWVPGGVLYVIMMSILFVAWMGESERRRAAGVALATTLAAFTAAGCGRAEARSVPGGNAERGRTAIATAGCGACHVIPGVPGAEGDVGPPLSGLARRAIVGGVLPNTADNMTAWLEDPPAFAPRTTMPNLGLSAAAARDIAAYLYSLK